jgi:GNAT superfamily N-acetyltransferase
MSDHFPCEVGLKDGTRVLVRRLTESDGPALWAFFQRQPLELRRLAWDDVSDRDLVESWARNVDYESTLPMVAVHGSKIIADATLRYRPRGPLRLSGRVRWFIDADYRGRGLGTILANLLIQVGRENGLRHLTCMLSKRLESRDIEILRERGFSSHEFPGYGTDPDGSPEDLTYLVCAL